MKLPQARVGEPLEISKREIDFSFFPMRRGDRRWGVHTMLYAADPWAVILDVVRESLDAGPDRQAAQSFVRQAQEYFTAAERAANIETRPLLFYYSFLNLAKALAMTRGQAGLVGKVTHGVHVVGGTGHSVAAAEIAYGRSGPGSSSATDELHKALHGSPVPTGQIPIREVIAQSVVGHRLWYQAASRRERFFPVTRVELLHDESTSCIWGRLLVESAVLKARGRGVNETVVEAGLDPDFRAVRDAASSQVACRVFEQRQPTIYSHRPSDEVHKLVALAKPVLWQTVTATSPYRQFYIYLSPSGAPRLPQWLAVYTTFFWLGSLTRYQPVELFDVLESNLGGFFREFLATQPAQLLYSFASEFKQQNVSRPGVV